MCISCSMCIRTCKFLVEIWNALLYKMYTVVCCIHILPAIQDIVGLRIEANSKLSNITSTVFPNSGKKRKEKNWKWAILLSFIILSKYVKKILYQNIHWTSSQFFNPLSLSFQNNHLGTSGIINSLTFFFVLSKKISGTQTRFSQVTSH